MKALCRPRPRAAPGEGRLPSRWQTRTHTVVLAAHLATAHTSEELATAPLPLVLSPAFMPREPGGDVPEVCLVMNAQNTVWLWTRKQPVSQSQPLSAMVWESLEVSLPNLVRL